MAKIGEYLYCDFCGKPQHEVQHIIVNNPDKDKNDAICNECIELSAEILVEEGVSEGLFRLEKSIKFPPEFRQAGISILNYFADILEQKYPDIEVSVRIEQSGNNVKMVIESPDGSREIIEKALEQYGLVVSGEKPPESLLDDKMQLMALNNKLEIAAMELRHNRDLLKIANETSKERIQSLETQVETLNKLVGKSLLSVNNLTQYIKQSHKFSYRKDGIETSLQIISDLISKGVSESDKELVEETYLLIKEQDPAVLKSVKDFIEGTLTSVSGNFLYQWILPFVNAMPK